MANELVDVGPLWDVSGSIWSHITICVILVVLRLAYRSFRLKQLMWDDMALVLATITLIGNGICIELWESWDYEPTTSTLPPPGLVLIGSLQGTFNSLTLAFSKTALALILLSFTEDRRWLSITTRLSIVAINLLFFLQIFTFWFQDCKEESEEPYRISRTCMRFDPFKFFRVAVQSASCAMDLFFLVAVWVIISGLQLKRKEKAGIWIAMSIGVFSLACGLARLVGLQRLGHSEPREKQPFYATGSYVWNFVEAAETIIAACVPVLRVAFHFIRVWFTRHNVQELVSRLPTTRRSTPARGLIEMERSASKHSLQPQFSNRAPGATTPAWSGRAESLTVASEETEETTVTTRSFTTAATTPAIPTAATTTSFPFRFSAMIVTQDFSATSKDRASTPLPFQ
ncbi:hypothetical protein F5Y15DRAFT_422787 [Xylariaceae sp. FL0016]|nr:hypothetical protein F5Y15DRAFT_422787 [Xylariaceae sp. FL0016]